MFHCCIAETKILRVTYDCFAPNNFAGYFATSLLFVPFSAQGRHFEVQSTKYSGILLIAAAAISNFAHFPPAAERNLKIVQERLSPTLEGVLEDIVYNRSYDSWR